MEQRYYLILIVMIALICWSSYRIYTYEMKKVSCPSGESCVRFCCFNETICENENHFELHTIPHLKEEIGELKQNFNILKGSCSDYYESDASWTFLEVCINFF